MTRKLLLLFFIVGIMSNITKAQVPERTEIPEKYKWNLGDIYATNDLFQADVAKLEKDIPSLEAYKGRLGKSSDDLYNALRTYIDLVKTQVKMVVYSYRLADQDMRISDNQSLKQQTENVGNLLSEKASFIEPEILQIDPKKIEQFLKEKPELEEFRFYLENLQRMREHTLSEKEEQILASAGMISDSPVEIYNIFNNAERKYPVVKLSNGEEVEINAAGFSKHRTSANREDRAKVFEAFFNDYKQYEATLGAALAGKVKRDYFFAKNRKYDTALEYSLNGNNIPVSFYENLIKQINENLPTLHRALKLKEKMLGVDQLHYYDLYVPLVNEVEMPFTVEEGQETVLEALKPMGEEYISTVQKSFDDRWIDFYPAKGKRSGAYSSGAAYDIHPYILHNWLGDFESVSTLAHELGHTMHSYFTNTNQPFVNSGYATFVAEIASTINENLLNNYMVKKAKSDEEKLFLLGSYLELLRTTIFRQTSFAEFEWEIHKRIENNQPLTGKIMSEIYFDIVKKYYGHDKGVCVVDDYIASEWSYIPHFLNYTYYVYQYSSSLILSTAFAEKIVTDGQPAIDKFYTVLKGGGSDYPINLVKDAGIDPLSPEAFNLTMKKMNDVMDQIETIIDKKG